MAIPLRIKRTLLAASLALWILAIGYGARRVLLYADTPGHLAAPPPEWPSGTPIRPSAGRATLLVFVHPQCPCSRSTIGELAQIIACCRNRVDATVFFYLPTDAGPEWRDNDLWRDATIIPGVRVLGDRDAAAARRFGARTSGQVLVYDGSRRLVFNGGITRFRGHFGDNDGLDAITAFLRGESRFAPTAAVFGCALFGD